LKEFAEIIRVNPQKLLATSQNIEDNYRTWYKRKSDGRQRQIDEPKKYLKEIQQILLKKIPFFTSPQAHGGVKGRSARTNSLVHRHSKYLLTIDIKNAYPTVNKKMIYWFFRQMNASAQLARVLSRLTTFRNQLPQGAPTSLAIFNALLGADNLLGIDSLFCKAKVRGRPLRYSRYVDDLTFSASIKIPKEIEKLVAKRLEKAGFNVNQKKTRYGSIKRGALRITGVNLVEGKPKVPPKEIKRFRGMIGRAIIDGSVSSDQVFGTIAYVMGIEKKIPNQLLKPLLKYLEKTIVPCPPAISRQIKKQLIKK